MTVTYSLECSTSGLATFLKLLLRWRGSIYKLLYKEMIIFVALYFALSFSYRFALDDNQQTVFEKVSMFCEKYMSFIPLTFVLSFFVSTVVGRWWNVFNAIAWVDRTALHVACYVHGTDERSRMIRRTLMRYLNLAHVFVLRDISSAVKKRFPSHQQIVNAGFITEAELKTYNELESPHHRYWLPILWCCTLLSKAKDEGYLNSDFLLNKVNNEVLNYRNNLQMLLNYDWISIPLVYTQVVTIAVYGFFVACLMGRQYLNPSKGYEGHDIDLYVPVFTLLQFLFYMGWLKVAETLLNPLGEDDDDFEVNYILDRNLQVGYLIVDENFNKLPQLERDLHWDELQPEIPYTVASVGLKDNPQVGSATAVQVKPEDAQIAPATSDEPDEGVGRKLSRAVQDGSKQFANFLRRTSRQQSVSTGSGEQSPNVKRQDSVAVANGDLLDHLADGSPDIATSRSKRPSRKFSDSASQPFRRRASFDPEIGSHNSVGTPDVFGTKAKSLAVIEETVNKHGTTLNENDSVEETSEENQPEINESSKQDLQSEKNIEHNDH